jgi:hypothetical protein
MGKEIEVTIAPLALKICKDSSFITSISQMTFLSITVFSLINLHLTPCFFITEVIFSTVSLTRLFDCKKATNRKGLEQN